MKIPGIRSSLIKGAKLKFVRIHSPEQIELAERGGYPKECFMPPDEFFRKLKSSLPSFAVSDMFCAQFFQRNIDKIDPAEVLLAGHTEAKVIFRDPAYDQYGHTCYGVVGAYFSKSVLQGCYRHPPVYADHSIHDPFYPFYIIGYV